MAAQPHHIVARVGAQLGLGQIEPAEGGELGRNHRRGGEHRHRKMGMDSVRRPDGGAHMFARQIGIVDDGGQVLDHAASPPPHYDPVSAATHFENLPRCGFTGALAGATKGR